MDFATHLAAIAASSRMNDRFSVSLLELRERSIDHHHRHDMSGVVIEPFFNYWFMKVSLLTDINN